MRVDTLVSRVSGKGSVKNRMAGIEKQVKKAVKGKGTGGKKSSSKGGSAKGVEKAAKKLLK